MTDTFIQAAVWAAVMLTVAGVAALIIARSAQMALTGMARAAGQALAQSEAKARPAGPQPQLVTEGRASLRIPEGAQLVNLVRRQGNDDAAPDEKPLSDLAAALVACGIEPTHVVDADADGGRLRLSYLVSSHDLSARVAKAALTLGFAEENRRERQPFAPIDAQSLLGRKATERAVANAEVLRERLGVGQELAIVSAEMATEQPGDVDGLVVMAARVVWRHADRPALRAAG